MRGSNTKSRSRGLSPDSSPDSSPRLCGSRVHAARGVLLLGFQAPADSVARSLSLMARGSSNPISQLAAL